MSDQNNPIETLFQLQQDTIRQSQDLLEEGLRMPREMSDTLYGGVDAQREIQAQTLEVTRKSVHTSLDAAESVVGGSGTLDDLRDAVDETFDTLAERQDRAFDAADENYDEFGGNYDELSEDALENLGDQVEEAQGRVSEQFEELADRFEAQLDDLSEQFEEQADRFSELERRIEEVGPGEE